MRKLPKLDFIYINFEKTFETWCNKNEIYLNLLGEENVDDKYHFDDYIKVCSLDDLIYLFIYLYVDRYPKDHKFPLALSLESKDDVIEEYIAENKRKITEEIHDFYDFERKDIVKFIYQFRLEIYGVDEQIESGWPAAGYSKYFFLEFTEEIATVTIEEVIAHKKYTKTIKDGLITYVLEDSPIATLEVTKKSIKLTINEDKVIDYAHA